MAVLLHCSFSSHMMTSQTADAICKAASSAANTAVVAVSNAVAALEQGGNYRLPRGDRHSAAAAGVDKLTKASVRI